MNRSISKRRACQPAKDVEIPVARGLDDVRRQGRRWMLAVPVAQSPLTLEIIAQRLLVEAWLRSAPA